MEATAPNGAVTDISPELKEDLNLQKKSLPVKITGKHSLVTSIGKILNFKDKDTILQVHLKVNILKRKG